MERKIKMKIAIVGNFPEGTVEAFEKKLPGDFEILKIDTQEKFDKLSEAECVVLRIFKMPEDRIEQIKNLKLIQRWGTGFDSVDIEAAGQRGILVANTPGVNAVSVSEMAVGLMLAVYKNIVIHNIGLKNGIWTREIYSDKTFTLNGKKVGLVGAGSIGRKVSALVQAFGAEVQYYDLYRMNEAEEIKNGMKYLPLDDLLATSDIVSIHVPLSEATENLIDGEKLKLMKPTAVLINTSRGGIVNEADLYTALINNEILGAGIDCPVHEPIESEDPLLQLDNVVLTPHVGGTSADMTEIMLNVIIQNIMNLYNGESVNYVVNKDYI